MSYNLYSLAMAINGMTSLQRMLEWIDNKEVEDDYIKPRDPNQEDGEVTWPTKGEIKAKNVVMKYREGLPRVLKGLNFEVRPREKVGIVGRTGSGKSSLILAIMRIVEQDFDLKDPKTKYKSYIQIDGLKLHKLGIKTARSAVTLIPQDPFLISGTVRSNVDPFDKFTDE